MNDLERLPSLRRKNLLHMENVYKQYGTRMVLDNIDLSVAHGELCTVVHQIERDAPRHVCTDLSGEAP